MDSHIHLFDTSRPQGVPWPSKDSSIYRNAMPDHYRRLASPLGITGAVAIECSPWPSDNQWLLDTARQDSIIKGIIGNLEPGTQGFAKELERLAKDNLFRGIRYGNLWGRDLGAKLSDQAFISDMKMLASGRLVLDTANPDADLISTVVRLTDRAPDLTVVIDHLPALRLPIDQALRKSCEADLQRLAQRTRVSVKLSGIIQRTGDRVSLKVNNYREYLEQIWSMFGEDRVLYGSDWPNSEQWANYAEVFQLAKDFISSKNPVGVAKFYWKNSLRVYGLTKG